MEGEWSRISDRIAKQDQLLSVAARGVFILYRENVLEDIELTSRCATLTGSGKSSIVHERWIICLVISGSSVELA
jgi:hypothetical protein